MKELLSIEQKAKRYDEAIERAKEWYTDTVIGIGFKANLEKLFPELKDDNDRIRKDIISMCQTLGKEEWVAWLEYNNYTFEIKEGHWYKCICDYMLNHSDLMFKNDRLYYCGSDWRLIGEIDERNVKDIGVKGYKSFFRPATNQEIKDWLEKQGEMDIKSYKAAEDEKREFVGNGFIKCYANFQDFKEGETYWLDYVGNDNYNVRSDNLLGKTYHITPCQLYTIFKKQTWLEKKGEPTVIIPKFRVGDEIKTSNEESLTITKIDEKGYWSENLFICNFDDADKWKLVEQKSAWSEEDELNLSEAIYHIRMYNLANKADKLDKWLKSLKDRVCCEANCITTKEWSEEDIMRIDNLIAIIENKGYPDYVEYLEKLKDRVQPQPKQQ